MRPEGGKHRWGVHRIKPEGCCNANICPNDRPAAARARIRI